jgi:hypothetical protein
MKKFLILLSLLIFASSSVKAAPFGVEITYRPLYSDSTVYEITFKMYRQCNSIALTSISSAAKIKCTTSTTSTNLSPTLKSIRNVSAFNNNSKVCNPPNTFGTGEGVEEIIFMDTVDFSLSPYSSYYNCSETIVEFGGCCRNSNLNTGPANSTIYSTASFFFNNFSNNSSSSATIDPIFNVPVSKPIKVYNKQEDADGDSLSFEIVSPLSSLGTSVTFSTGFYADQPLSVYYPGSLTYPYSAPTASPPIGFYFDETRGDMVFTPTSTGDRSIYVIETTEWRKDANDSMRKAGITRREMSISAEGIIGNLPKFVGLGNNYSSCIGESNSISLKGSDPIFVPPPPAPSIPDTLGFLVVCDYPVYLTVDSQTYNVNTEIYGSLSWHTDSFSSVPDQFEVLVYVFESNSTNNYTYDVKRLTVTNYERPSLTTQVNKIGCGKIAMSASLDTFNNNTSIVSFNVEDEFRNPIYNGFISTFQAADTFQLRRRGTYYIKTTSSYALSCETVVIDTIVIDSNEAYELPLESDLLTCYSSNQDLTVASIWKKATWSTGDTTKSILVDTSGTYGVVLQDSCGDTTSFEFHVRFRSFESQQIDTTICSNGIASFTINPIPQLSWAWPGGSTSPKYTTSSNGLQILSIYDSVCAYRFNDTFYVNHKYKPSISISKSEDIICEDSSYQIIASGDTTYQYLWNNGSTTDTAIVHSSGLYILVASNECGYASDSITLTTKLRPILALSGDTIICRGDTGVITANYNSDYTYLWETGSKGISTEVKNEKFYVLTSSNNCGITKDSIYVYVIDTPEVYLGPDTAKNKFDIINVKNRLPSRFVNYLWSIGSNADNIDIKLEGTYWLIETNKCGTGNDSIVVTYILGIKELNQHGFKIYPVPAQNSLTVENKNGKPSEVKIYSQEGKEVSSHLLFGNKATYDVSELARGTYIVQIIYENKVLSNTIILN